jgi:hypothetical protein
MSRIACFGASVVQQGGPNSFFHHLSKSLKELGYSTASFGYGSTHIVNSGVCFIDTVLEFKPNICFLEWLTSGCYTVEKDGLLEYWNAMIYKFSKAKCKLILLILPRLDWDADRETMMRVSIEHMAKYGIPVINLSKAFPNIKDLLRDYVHTNQAGAEAYSKAIMEQFIKLEGSLTIPNLGGEGETKQEEYKLVPNKYCNIKTFNFNYKIYKKMKFTLEGEIIGFYMNVGPFSSELLIKSDQEERNYRLWDEWSYYDRQVIKLHIKSEKKSEYTLLLTDNPIDRSKAKTQLEWDTITKYFHPLKIFYVGDIAILEFE